MLSSEHRVIDANAACRDPVRLAGRPNCAARPVRPSSRAPTGWPLSSTSRATPAAQPKSTSTADGDRVPVEFRGRAIVYARRARRGSLAFADLRERKKAEERIRHLAHARSADRPAEPGDLQPAPAMICSAGGRNAARPALLLLIDLDRFKDINDLHGHPAGDAVIARPQNACAASPGPADLSPASAATSSPSCRPTSTSRTQAADLAHRIVQAISEPVDIGNGDSIRPGASIGIALCAARRVRRRDAVLARRRRALSCQEQRPEHLCRASNRAWTRICKRRRELEADLESAVDAEQFEPVLPAAPRRRSATASSATRRCCAGTIRCAA